MSMNREVVETILSQIGGPGRLKAMIGANQFIGDGNKLIVRFKAKARDKINVLEIELNGNDLYDVSFNRVYGDTYKTIRSFDNVYTDMLKTLIEEETGLYLSL